MAGYVVERSTEIAAPVERLHALIADLRRWEAWSPWADLDPDMHREYSGPESGVGARSAWSGNRRAGAGRMEVVADAPERVDVDLRFEKPFRSESSVAFLLVPTDRGTEVT